MTFTPRPHQVCNATQMLDSLRNFGCALDGSDTGTGKTYTFLNLCKSLGARPAIITRKTVIPAWEDACKLVGVVPLFITNYEACLSRTFPHGRVTTSKTGHKGYEWTVTEPRVIFCFDEAQALRNLSTVATKCALDATRKYKTVLLSATPFQSPLEAGGIGQMLKLFGSSEYYRWLYNHGCKKNHFQRLEFIGSKKDPDKGLEIMAKIHADIFPSRGCRTRRAEIPGFPESLITADVIETGAAEEITKHYLAEIELRKKADHEKACEEVDPEFHYLVDVLPIVRDLRHRQAAEMLKVEAYAEQARMYADRGAKVAIFVNFDSTIQALKELLPGAETITGADMRNTRRNFQRVRVARLFQENYRDFLLVNVAAGGAGLNLHDPEGKVERVALISPPFSAVMLRQVLGRVHRLGGAYSQQRILFAKGTIEETKVFPAVQNKLANLDALLDSDLL